jgi:hypothetical protein
LIRRVVRLKRGGTEHRTRSVVLLCLDSLALFCSLWAILQFYFDGLDEPGLMFGCLGVLILLGTTLFHRFVKEEKPVFTVKLYKKKLLLLSLAVLLLLPAFIPVSYSDRMVYQNDVGCTGRHYHAIAYSLVVRTENDKAVDFNIAIFPFNYQKKVYVHLDEFD